MTHYLLPVVVLASASLSMAQMPPTTAPVPESVARIVGEKTVESGAAVQDCTIESFKIHSKAMNRDIDVVVVLPPAYAQNPDTKFPVLHTLHGHSAPYATWSKMDTLREALKDQPMIVTCFNGDKAGWYLDSPEKADTQFTTFFLTEFIPFIDATYRTTAKASGRGVTGFSMGGFGAFHYMLESPKSFASVSSASSRMSYMTAKMERVEKDLAGLLGPRATNEERYLAADVPLGLDRAIAKGVKLPPMLLTCGTEDKGIEGVRAFRDRMLKHKQVFEYVESPGEHNWAYWRGIAPRIIDFHHRSFQPNYLPKDQAK
jgi:S-formylglutathione hydrolase FrmB